MPILQGFKFSIKVKERAILINTLVMEVYSMGFIFIKSFCAVTYGKNLMHKGMIIKYKNIVIIKVIQIKYQLCKLVFLRIVITV